MKRRKTIARLLIIGAVASLLLASAVWSQLPRVDVPPIGIPERGVLQVQIKPRVPFNFDFSISEIEAARRPEILNRSMRARREVAWQILNRAWGPSGSPRISLGAGPGYLPVWMTWYEQEDIAQLYEEMLRRRATARLDPAAEVNAALGKHAIKDLQVSLSSARLGKTLRQFLFPEARDLGPHRTAGTGAIYYSPAYVKHFLENAERIANCDPNAYPKPSSKSPRSGLLTDFPPILDIDSVPARLRPSNPKNFYALCMDHEMPRDAVMIKTAWARVSRGPKALGRSASMPGVRYFNLEQEMASRLYMGPAGQWIEKPWSSPEVRVRGGEWLSENFIVTDETGQEWALLGMHIVTKILRNWMWISMFWVDNDQWAWRGDKQPDRPSPANQLYRYAMCVVSDFTEGDPAPWAAYDGTDRRFLQQQANTFRAVSHVMKGTQWCSNPYIETNMARGNCIGCHQGSPNSFLPTTLTKQQGFNISDFSFSFATNRANIIDIRRRHGL